eukprot:1280489-Prymnesium_polylepis.1
MVHPMTENTQPLGVGSTVATTRGVVLRRVRVTASAPDAGVGAAATIIKGGIDIKVVARVICASRNAARAIVEVKVGKEVCAAAIRAPGMILLTATGVKRCARIKIGSCAVCAADEDAAAAVYVGILPIVVGILMCAAEQSVDTEPSDNSARVAVQHAWVQAPLIPAVARLPVGHRPVVEGGGVCATVK